MRFNANHYDLNRHWLTVDLKDKQWLQKMPEIWYVKKAIRDAHRQAPIDLVINLHNNDTNEYLSTAVGEGPAQALMQNFFRLLAGKTLFEPSRPDVTITATRGREWATTNALWDEFGIPTVLVEQRIGPSRKLNRRPTPEDRLDFGRQLAEVAGEVLRQAPASPTTAGGR